MDFYTNGNIKNSFCFHFCLLNLKFNRMLVAQTIRVGILLMNLERVLLVHAFPVWHSLRAPLRRGSQRPERLSRHLVRPQIQDICLGLVDRGIVWLPQWKYPALVCHLPLQDHLCHKLCDRRCQIISYDSPFSSRTFLCWNWWPMRLEHCAMKDDAANVQRLAIVRPLALNPMQAVVDVWYNLLRKWAI